jgi:hypothetical protein
MYYAALPFINLLIFPSIIREKIYAIDVNYPYQQEYDICLAYFANACSSAILGEAAN